MTVHSFRRLYALVIALALSLAGACQPAGTPGQSQPADTTVKALPPGQAPAVSTDSTLVARPVVQTGCVPDQPRTSFAEIRWVAPPSAAPRQDSATVDFTVFKDGFQATRYATVSASAQEPRMQLLYRPDVDLRAMSIRAVASRRAGDTTIVRVERLDPGINYFWRVRANVDGRWVAGAVVRIQAPTCVHDEPQQQSR